MKKQQTQSMNNVMVGTAFGPVPFNATKKYISKEAVKYAEDLYSQVVIANDPNTVDHYIYRLAARHNWPVKKMYSYIQNLDKFSPAAALNVVLKEIALAFDEKYEDQIENSEKIFTISMTNGKVIEVDKATIRNYRNFPAFRTKEEAVLAHRILSKEIRSMFRGGEQES